MIQFGIFILLSVLLFAFTVKRPHRHRFPRFFAFESILALVLINASGWFQNPFSLRQLVSWLFLAGSLILAIHGFQLLEAKSQDPALSDIPVIVLSARDPAGQPIVSNALAITQKGGLSMHHLLAYIKMTGQVLSIAAPSADPMPSIMSSGWQVFE